MFDDVTKPVVIECLHNSGWIVIHDPKHIHHEGYNFYIDLEVECDGDVRLIEIKSFKRDFLDNWNSGIGKWLTYRTVLNAEGNDTPLYLAVPYKVYKEHFTNPLIKAILVQYSIRIVVYNANTKRITKWI